MLVKEILHQRSARQLQTYATSAELTTAATRLFKCFISAWHVSPVLEFFPETLVVGVQRFGVFCWFQPSSMAVNKLCTNLAWNPRHDNMICKIPKWKNVEACLFLMVKFCLSCFPMTLNVHHETISIFLSGGNTPSY